ncbi:MAG: Holliday junction branch migration DNA helicase RuvB [Acidobacteriota bacterium]|nr:MAG: Holliday junction branch migration DNA helicase RuvB [Acidobacteriota bacterium]
MAKQKAAALSRKGPVAPVAAEDDLKFEASLRPPTLSEFIGQKVVKKNLGVFLEAARRRGEALDHALFYGPPGLGKTTLAHIVAREMDVPIVVTSGPAIEKTGDVAAILTNLAPRSVLFIDEIHRLPRVVEEMLYPAMEDYHLDVVIGEGPGARSVSLNLPPFTLAGATTRAGLLTSPLRERFGIVHRLDYYTPEDILKIIRRSAALLNIEVTEEGAQEMSRRARGTPRIANRFLRRVRDFAEVEGDGVISRELARSALESMQVDDLGFHDLDRRILLTLIEKFQGGPVGLGTISAAIGEEEDTIEDIYEPFLIQVGFLDRTPRGRCATALAFKHFGFDESARQKPLF